MKVDVNKIHPTGEWQCPRCKEVIRFRLIENPNPDWYGDILRKHVCFKNPYGDYHESRVEQKNNKYR